MAYQGSRLWIGLAVPGRPIRSLVAVDRSADGVRDQTGPEPTVAQPCWSVLGLRGIGKWQSWEHMRPRLVRETAATVPEVVPVPVELEVAVPA